MRENAEFDPADLDREHEAKPYDQLLLAGFCLICRWPIRIDDRGAWTHAEGAPETPRRAKRSQALRERDARDAP